MRYLFALALVLGLAGCAEQKQPALYCYPTCITKVNPIVVPPEPKLRFQYEEPCTKKYQVCFTSQQWLDAKRQIEAEKSYARGLSQQCRGLK